MRTTLTETPAVVRLDHGVLDEFLMRAMVEYRDCTPDAPPRCFAVLIGDVEGDVARVRGARFARTVRSADPPVADEWASVIVPRFGRAYANERRGFWVDPDDLRRIHRQADASGLDLIGSVHLHPDWHRIGPPHERGMVISEQPTPMDRYLFINSGWQVNLICYLEQIGAEFFHTLGAWGASPDGTCPPLQVRHNLGDAVRNAAEAVVVLRP